MELVRHIKQCAAVHCTCTQFVEGMQWHVGILDACMPDVSSFITGHELAFQMYRLVGIISCFPWHMPVCARMHAYMQVRDMARFIQAAREHISDPQAPEAAGLHVHHFCVALLTALVHTTSVPAPPRAPRRIPGSPFQLRAASGPLVHSSRHASGQASSSTGTTSSSTTNTDVGSTKDSVSNSGGATISTTSTSRSGRSGNSSGRSQVSQLSATAVQPLYTQDVGRVCTEVVWLVCKERRHLNLEVSDAATMAMCSAWNIANNSCNVRAHVSPISQPLGAVASMRSG